MTRGRFSLSLYVGKIIESWGCPGAISSTCVESRINTVAVVMRSDLAEGVVGHMTGSGHPAAMRPKAGSRRVIFTPRVEL